ncbi:hypothetical protein GC163_15015 [bacterium]|nr:hypothetical protein [bacterium]
MSLCETCRHCRVITTPKGSRFLMCQLAQRDSRYPKYPPQPVRHCTGYESTATSATKHETPNLKPDP